MVFLLWQMVMNIKVILYKTRKTDKELKLIKMAESIKVNLRMVFIMVEGP